MEMIAKKAFGGWVSMIGASLCAMALTACVVDSDSSAAAGFESDDVGEAAQAAATLTYPVGVSEFLMTDASREETFTPENGDKREIVIRAWYPAQTSLAPVSPYLSPAEAAFVTLVLGGTPEVQSDVAAIGQVLHLTAREGAPVSSSNAKYPTVVLLPGLGEMPEFYSVLAEQLASSGYMVLVINHPFDSLCASLSGGRFAMHSPLLDSSSDPPDQPGAYRERAIALRTADTAFLLNALRTPNPQPSLLARVDLNRIVVAGHSIGGSTLGAMATHSSLQGVRGMAILDSNCPQPPPALTIPLLVLQSEQTYGFGEMSMTGMTLNSRAGGYHAVLPGSYHASFTDEGLIGRELPLLGALMGTTPLAEDALAVRDLYKDLTKAFLTKAVINKYDSTLDWILVGLSSVTQVHIVRSFP